MSIQARAVWIKLNRSLLFSLIDQFADLTAFRQVAIKLVHRTKDPSAAARVKSLWSEFKTVRAVSRVEAHPNIVRFDSFVITPGYALIAMPQYDRLIPVKLPEKVATGYFAQLVSAVDFLHSNGCTHNDIKPANILLHNDRPIIVDFGFAQHYNSTSTARFIDAQSWGTPEYLSPERARGSVHDSRLSDIWSLGVTFYEIVTGRTPFERTDSEEFLSKDALQVYCESFSFERRGLKEEEEDEGVCN